MKKLSRTWLYALAAVIALALLTGCAQTSGYKKPVEDFQRSLNESAVIIAGYYNDLNQFERSVYLNDRLYFIKKNSEDEGNVDGLRVNKKHFLAKAVQARLDTLNLLGAYGCRLAELAGSDAPARFESAAATLGKNLKSTFEELVKDGDKQAENYVAPIANLAAVLGRMYLEHLRDQELTEIIKQGDSTVKALLTVLEKDMGTVVTEQLKTGWKENLGGAVLFYKKNKSSLSFSERKIILTEIGEMAKRYDAINDYPPTELVRSIRTAHESLVKYARSDRGPKNLAELVEAMDVFNARIKQIIEVYAQLRGL